MKKFEIPSQNLSLSQNPSLLIQKIETFFSLFLNFVCFLFFSSWTTINPLTYSAFFLKVAKPFFCKCNARDASIFSLVFLHYRLLLQSCFRQELGNAAGFPKGPSSKMYRRSTLFHLADNKTKGRKIFFVGIGNWFNQNTCIQK